MTALYLEYANKVVFKEGNFLGLELKALYSALLYLAVLYLSCWVSDLYSNRIQHDFSAHIAKNLRTFVLIELLFSVWRPVEFRRRSDKGFVILQFVVCVLCMVTKGRLCNPLCPLSSPSLSPQPGYNWL